MRISTSSMYATATSQLSTLQSQVSRTQQQLASNRRLLSASDDPIASARAMEVTQSQTMNAQFATNRQNARAALTQEEGVLTGVQQLILDVQEIAVAAGNGTASNVDRATYANELEGRLVDLMSLANSSDGNGGYMFAGFKSSTLPFVQTAQGVEYAGDQGQAKLQVGSSRKVAIGDPGSAVFTNLPTGNGSFVTGTGVGNAGTGVISAGFVSDPRQLTGHTYSIDFTVAPGAPPAPAQTSYVVTDTTLGVTVPAAPAPAAQPYTSGQPIVVGGMQFDIQGVPASTDKFTVKPSERQSLFDTLSKMIDTLRAPANTAVERKAMSAGLAEAGGNLGTALDNVLAVRSSVGSRLKEFDTLDVAGVDADINYAATLEELEGLDIIKAITQLTQQQSTLEAAQKTFKSMSGMSLFNYIG